MSEKVPEMDPYAVLGIPQDSPSELIEIAYGMLSKRYPIGEKIGSGNLRSQIDRAYQLLTSKSTLRLPRIALPRRHFSMAVEPSRKRLPILSEPQTLYLRVDLGPNATLATEEMAFSKGRLNLTLVLDRSNSMQGARLDRVKSAAYQVIDSMNPEDVISVVAFSDRASVLIPATKVGDKPRLKAQIALLSAFGGTEMYHGLAEGLKQNREYFDSKFVNHLIVITDGNTYGDEEQCHQLAANAAIDGIGISAMGLGTDWNDDFLDKLASATGGFSQFIRSVQEVGHYINSHVRHLANTFAERIRLIPRLSEGIEIEQAFKIAPLAQPIEISKDELRIGILESERPTSIVLQLRLPPSLSAPKYHLGRVIITGEILSNAQTAYHLMMDLELPTTTDIAEEEPSTRILEALSRLALYRMQESASEAIKRGDILTATVRLEKLATRLLAMGQSALATHVIQEAEVVKTTHMLSAEGKKTIKYHTRQLAVETRKQGAD